MTDSVLDTWAARVSLRSRRDEGGALVWAGLETAYRLARSGEGFEVSERSRGRERLLARLGSLADAELFVLLLIAMPWRSQHGLPVPFAPGFPDDVVLAAVDHGFDLTWNGGSAWFRSESDARRFSRMRGLDLADASALLAAH